jgi:pyrimidine deaminase RibD-like protein
MNTTDNDYCRMVIEAARSAMAEDASVRPKVAAAVERGGKLLGIAFRGELMPGEHAEFTLLQRKLSKVDLAGTSLFTTLEPCTTRNHPKRPCSDWIIERKIGRVVIGMLDPNPQVYERGVARLRAAGIMVDFFPQEMRVNTREDNRSFIEQFRASPALTGTITFNFKHNDGRYSLGHGDLLFETRWSNAGSSAIHIYRDGTNLEGIAHLHTADQLAHVRDASVYDMSSRALTPREGHFAVLRNVNDKFAVLRVDDVRARSHGDDYDSLTLTYWINSDGSPRFVQEEDVAGQEGSA